MLQSCADWAGESVVFRQGLMLQSCADWAGESVVFRQGLIVDASDVCRLGRQECRVQTRVDASVVCRLWAGESYQLNRVQTMFPLPQRSCSDPGQKLRKHGLVSSLTGDKKRPGSVCLL
ncbi:unnamed protein product [Ectocarpus sp. 13 AM-2016]